MKHTNGRELGALFLAFAVRIAVSYAVSAMLARFYLSLYRAGGGGLMMTGTTGVFAVMLCLTLPLFLLFRGWLGGVPASVAPGRTHGFVSTGKEIAAYLVTALIILIVSMALNFVALAPMYLQLRLSGNGGSVMPIALLVSVVYAVIFAVVFVALRQLLVASQTAAAPVPAHVLAAASAGTPPAPAPGGPAMGFGGAIAACFGKFAVFRGRARRPEYWYWILFEFLLLIPASILDLVVFGVSTGPFYFVVVLILFLPSLGVTVRRLHDIDRSGWFVFISLIPLVGGLILIIMVCRPGTAGQNRFGPEFA